MIATKRLPGITAVELKSTAVMSHGCTGVRHGGDAGIGEQIGQESPELACCTVAVYGRVAPIMPGKKQKAATVSLADALAATRSAHRRVLALAARLEATERTILAAMASAHAPATAAPSASAAPAKRPVGRPRKTPAATATAPRPVGRPVGSRTTTVKRPVGRPKG